MFRYRREMYALQFKYICLAVLIIASLSFSEAIANGRGRRRYGPAANNNKNSAKESTEKSTTDQVPASSNTEPNIYRRGGAYSTDAGDYSYNNADINLIRPENKPLHTKITAKYTSSISIPTDSLEDTETAEEYVAKAMGMYGSRLREPIRIPSETEATQAEEPQLQYQHHAEQQVGQHIPEQQQQQRAHLQHQQQQQQQQQQLEQEEHRLQSIQNQEKPDSFEYYTFTQKDAHRSQEESNPSQYQYPSQVQTESDAKTILESQLRAQLQEQLQQAQYSVKEHEENSAQHSEPVVQDENITREPQAQGYEKDPVTRSYNLFEDQSENYQAAQSEVDRNYRTKYVYKQVPTSYHSLSSENEEKIRVSASTEIPKAEIMKQIEKSVIKYMKQLEDEGKILAAPQNQEAKTYYKVITVPGSEEKRIASTTLKPKYTSSTSNYPEGYKYSQAHAASLSGSASPSSSSGGSGKHHKHSVPKTAYVQENEGTFQAQGHEVSDALAPNVEFIYKIKTKAPLHTATVKTVSKPYNLPIKGNYDQFDHSTALKNLEEFDLTHVVSPSELEDHQSLNNGPTSKPSKLYFNSEIYHDINSMPYKQKQQRAEAEYRKEAAEYRKEAAEYRKEAAEYRKEASEYRKTKPTEVHPDYKGYEGRGSSGYYAEPPASEAERELASSSGMSEDGYPLMNPYQFILKKEPSLNKYEESGSNYEQPRNQKYKSVEFDSYSPKFNNNPEGYGYQQTYKTHLNTRHAPGKRGKRGGSPHPSLVKKSPHRSVTLKEYDANVALRPPPKI